MLSALLHQRGIAVGQSILQLARQRGRRVVSLDVEQRRRLSRPLRTRLRRGGLGDVDGGGGRRHDFQWQRVRIHPERLQRRLVFQLATTRHSVPLG